MPAHRKNDVANACIELYLDGYSLAEIAVVAGVTRQSMHKMLARRNAPMRHAVPRPEVFWQGDKYTLRNHGYYAKTTDGRQLLHRAMWEAEYGLIAPGYDIHHIDEDKTNNVLTNFDIHTKSEHGRRHGFGGNQHTGSLGRRPVRW